MIRARDRGRAARARATAPELEAMLADHADFEPALAASVAAALSDARPATTGGFADAVLAVAAPEGRAAPGSEARARAERARRARYAGRAHRGQRRVRRARQALAELPEILAPARARGDSSPSTRARTAA